MSLSPACGTMTSSRRERAAWAKHSASPFEHALAALTAPLKKFSAALRHRRELEQLARFGDRELRDLAVTRNDIVSPSAIGMRRANEQIVVRRSASKGRAIPRPG